MKQPAIAVHDRRFLGTAIMTIATTLIVATLALLGGGRFSLDSLLQRRCEQTIPKPA